MGRRKRSKELTEADAIEVVKTFASKINGMLWSSDVSSWDQGEPHDSSYRFLIPTQFPPDEDEKNYQPGMGLCWGKSFWDRVNETRENDKIFEAMRILGGHKLPMKEPN